MEGYTDRHTRQREVIYSSHLESTEARSRLGNVMQQGRAKAQHVARINSVVQTLRLLLSFAGRKAQLHVIRSKQAGPDQLSRGERSK